MPRISIIIPNYNGAPLLRRCLEKLAQEPGAKEKIHEIIVADDASTDNSLEVAREFGAKIVALKTNVGPSGARNEGAKQAEGDVLWFLDSDLEIRPGCVDVVYEYFNADSNHIAAVGSYDDDPSESNACSLFKNLMHHFVHQNAGDHISSFWAGCGAIRRDAFEQIGGYDSHHWSKPSVEDIHLGYLLGRCGYSIRVLKDLQVKHHKRWTLKSLIMTDVFDRAMPWTAMLLRNRGQGSNELNLGWGYRISVVAVYLSILAAMAAFFWPWALVLVPVFLAVPIRMNFALVRFFHRKRGAGFLVSAIPLLWLYFFYCGVGLILGIGLYFYESATGNDAFERHAALSGPKQS